MSGSPQSGELLSRASIARREGRTAEAKQILQTLLGREPDHSAALNLLGLTLLSEGQPAAAVAPLERAAAIDPAAVPLWLNLAQAHRGCGSGAAEIAALDRALAIDPYLLPALLLKAQAQERLGLGAEAVTSYRQLLSASPDSEGLPEPVRQALGHARRVVEADQARRMEAMAASLRDTALAYPDAEMARANLFVQNLAGRRKIYHPDPVGGGHFPFLPAFEYFDRSYFPWFDALEKQTDAIREELLSLWREAAGGFNPYVAFPASTPANQWKELNHSSRWSAWFLWKDGVRQDENCRRCPATAKAIEAAPLLDVPGKAPSVMFSVLEPHTRIPPHTGTTNTRLTVHLPLVVPDGCGFRVGGDTREWRVGEAWAFDDTIEHEAWNDSDEVRAILILDTWNPLLTEAERALVRRVG